LGDVAKIGTGATPLTSNLDYYENGSIPWVTSAATSNEFITKPTSLITQKAVNETNCTVYPIGTLVIAMYGEGKTRGQISELGIEAATNQACATIVPLIPEVYNKRYIKACFNKNYEDLRIQAKGAQQPNLNLSIISDFFIPLPPLAEQRRIVAAIESAFAVIDEIERNKTDLQAAVTAAKSKILSIAIRGKLVPQDPADEPASTLLERIRAEREALVKAGKIKRSKGDSIIEKSCDNSYYEKLDGKAVCVDEQIPFDVPTGWAWCRLGSICDYGSCDSMAADSISEDAWILDLEDIEKDTAKVFQFVRKRERPFTSTKHSFSKGQVLYSKLRPYLNKVVVAPEDGFCTSEILPLPFDIDICPEYVRLFLMSDFFLAYANRCSYGVKMPRLGTNDGQRALFALPPIAEQYRIAELVKLVYEQFDRITENLNQDFPQPDLAD